MREILFRGKWIDNGEWVKGLPFSFHANNNTEGIETYDGERHKVDPTTIGQYTGLTDKNGKRIFEGDILELTCTAYPQDKLLLSVHFGPYKIDEEDEYGCVVGWYTKGVGRIESFGKNSLFADAERANLYYEVIGNIHDNPELMEGD